MLAACTIRQRREGGGRRGRARKSTNGLQEDQAKREVKRWMIGFFNFILNVENRASVGSSLFHSTA